MKNPAKDTRFKYSDQYTHPCPYRLTRPGTSLWIRRKRTTNEERILVLDLYMLLTISAAGFFATHNNLFFIFHFFMYACLRSRMTAEVNCVFSKVVNTCLSFLNEVKNPSRKYRYYMLFLNEPNRKIKEWLWQKSRPRLSGKVAAEPSEGASVSRNKKQVWEETKIPIKSEKTGLTEEK